MKWLGIMLAAALLASVPGYGIAAQPAPKGTPAATQSQGPEAKGPQGQAAKSYTAPERQAYQKKIAADLDEYQRKIEDLKIKNRNIKSQKKRTFFTAMLDLQKQVLANRSRLAALEKAPENAWSGMKTDMDKAMGDLISNYNRVAAYFK